jgi:predicted MPP superfamily phosphohydrolase
MKPRYVAIIAAILLVYIGIHLYVGWNVLIYLSSIMEMPSTGLYWICFWFISFSYIAARLGERFLPHAVVSVLKGLGMYWMAILFYTFLLMPIANLTALVLSFSSVDSSDYVPVLGTVMSVIILLLFLRGFWNAWTPIVRTYEITLPKAAGDLKELQVAVASDLHLGTLVRRRYLNVLVNRINAMQPDLILFPGDVLDDSLEPFIRQGMSEPMSRLKARFGTFAVLGNHEYFGGHIDDYIHRMKEIGIEVLTDRTLQIANSFYIAGRKDKTAERATPTGRLTHADLLAGVDHTMPILMMDHQPYEYDRAAASGVDVLLSGHTHRGQMMPNHLITKRLFELDWGYKQKGSLHAIVSSGYGTWGPPIRIGSRSEIIRLHIRFQAPE